MPEFVFPPDMPEEMKHQIENSLTRQEMDLEAYKHDLQRLFDETPKEHLVTLRLLFSQLSGAYADGRYAAYLEGCVASVLNYKHHVCGGCGKDHAAELLAHPEPVDGGTQHSLFDKDEASPPKTHAETMLDYKRRCEVFGVTPTEPDNGEYDFDHGSVFCLNCGKIYPNLADRMVKPPGPENCDGCVHKAKWG